MMDEKGMAGDKRRKDEAVAICLPLFVFHIDSLLIFFG